MTTFITVLERKAHKKQSIPQASLLVRNTDHSAISRAFNREGALQQTGMVRHFAPWQGRTVTLLMLYIGAATAQSDSVGEVLSQASVLCAHVAEAQAACNCAQLNGSRAILMSFRILAGPPCASNCLYAVQGNLTLQNIATSTWTSFPELAILNDAKYVTSRPDQVYQPQTICVSATFCQAQSLISSSYEDGPKPCDSGCQLISGPNSTFAKVAEELTAAAQSRNSQAAGIAPISLLDLNPASDYAGSFQTYETTHRCRLS